MMKELNFEDIQESQLVDDLTYSCAVYNVEQCGMSWEDIATLFPDHAGLMEMRYKRENSGND